MTNLELLAPAGDMQKLITAIHFGADAVYLAGNNYGLRAGAKNFNQEQLAIAVEYCHARAKKLYITCNIVAHNDDFTGLTEYLLELDSLGVDGIIISDLGIFALANSLGLKAELHVSTQANVTNKYAANAWVKLGAKRIVLARELSLAEIAEMRAALPDDIALESFVHGAMCISHSGRCLLSNFLTKRDGNRGNCVQACRWEYTIHEKSRPENPLEISEDSRGTYIMNSKDLNMINYIDKLAEAGVQSFKIEGRMKTQYYVGSVVNAYRRAIDSYIRGDFRVSEELASELDKTSHRAYTTGFYLGEHDSVNLESSKADSDYDFAAEVRGYDEERGAIIVEQRNRFMVGDNLEILSNSPDIISQLLPITYMENQRGESIDDAKNVQEIVYIKSETRLQPHDLLRRRRKC